MLDKAITKLRAEMDQKANNPYVQVIGNFLINHVRGNPADAVTIASSDKTIEKSLDEMRREAEKKKVGNCAVLTDDEGFAIVLKYFGIRTGTIKQPEKNAAPETTPAAATVSPKSFDINLDDLLG